MSGWVLGVGFSGGVRCRDSWVRLRVLGLGEGGVRVSWGREGFRVS